jgi:hypothetical protein
MTRTRSSRRPLFESLESRSLQSMILLTSFKDPLPDPEPPPSKDEGNWPPIVYPILPPSGPSGPGS